MSRTNRSTRLIEPRTIEAEGGCPRSLQHEIDNLEGTLYIERINTRSLVAVETQDLGGGGTEIWSPKHSWCGRREVRAVRLIWWAVSGRTQDRRAVSRP